MKATVLLPQEHATRIPELDGIRGLAILMVLVWHFVAAGTIPCMPGPWGYTLKLLHHAYSGVDLFFVLSAFLISKILLQSIWKENGLKVFWIRRIFRILPLYTLYLGISSLLAATAQTTGLNFSAPPRIWPCFVSLQNFDMVIQDSMGPWGLTWSLAIEEQYCLILPLLLLLMGRKAFLPLATVFLTMPYFLRYQAGMGYPAILAHGQAAFLLLPFCLDGFAAGGILAWVTLNPGLMGKLGRQCWFPWSLFTIGLVLYAIITVRKRDRDPVDHLVFAFSYRSLILFCLTNSKNLVSWLMRRRWLCRLGVISYPLYLFHVITYTALEQTIPVGTFWHSGWALDLLGTAASIAVAELLHRVLGEPALNLGRKFVDSRYARSLCAEPSCDEHNAVRSNLCDRESSSAPNVAAVEKEEA